MTRYLLALVRDDTNGWPVYRTVMIQRPPPAAIESWGWHALEDIAHRYASRAEAEAARSNLPQDEATAAYIKEVEE